MHSDYFLRKTGILMMASLTLFSAQAFSAATNPPQNTNENKPVPLDDVQRFSNALSQIKKYYVKPVSDDTLFNNAIQGMVSSLDPHSAYLDEASYNDIQTSTSGEFGGLGLEVTMEEGVIKVVSPLVDTPAYKAGIKSGDYIIKLGSKAVQGLSLKEAVDLMRGKPATTIAITVIRKGEPKPLLFSLIREKILVKSVKSQLLDNHYGYIRLTQFQAMTAYEMDKAIAALQQQTNQSIKGMILDLRDNPGGLLDSAIEVADAFLDKDRQGKAQMIVYTQGRLPGSKFTAMANPGDLLHHAPLIVLINGGSASASEIVAGALKDNKRAIIVGTRSFGKGSVQTIIPLDNKHAIKLTTALYFTPSGVSIQAKGITPDIVVDEMAMKKADPAADLLNYSEADLNGHLDNQLTGSQSPVKITPKTQEETNLLQKDYQVYTALTILKGLAVAANR